MTDLPEKIRVDFQEITFAELGDALDASGVPDLAKATAGQQARANAAFAWVVLRRDYPDVTLEEVLQMPVASVEVVGTDGLGTRSARPMAERRADRSRLGNRAARRHELPGRSPGRNVPTTRRRGARAETRRATREKLDLAAVVMASTADVLVRFLADTSQIERGVNGMGGTLKNFAKTATTFLSGAAIGAFATSAVSAANDMTESVSKVNTVFGRSAGTIQKFASGAAENLGLSKQSALDAAGAYGNMFTQLGFTTDAAASMSTKMLTLTADIASFHNADPTAVLEAQQAAFRGEYDAVQKFIPTINAAAVEQRALADTHKQSAKDLTASEKAAAAYSLMIEGAGSATGDFARTSESAANQQRIMKAKMDDATVSVGQALQPALAVVVPLIGKLATAFAEAGPVIQNAAIALAGFGAAALLVGGPVGLVIAAVGLVVVGIVLMWTKWDEIWGWMKDHPAIALLVSILFAPVAAMFLIIGALKLLWENWDQIWGWIKQAASDAWDFIRGVWDDLVATVRGIPGNIRNAFSGIWEIITSPFRRAIDDVKNIIGELTGFFGDVIGGIRGIWNGFARGWNSIHFDIPSLDTHIPGIGTIGGGSFDLPHLRELARGGIVNSPTLALIGEAGPEAVVPLSRGGLGNVYSITVNVAPGVSPAEVGATVVDQIRAYERVAGRAWRGG